MTTIYNTHTYTTKHVNQQTQDNFTFTHHVYELILTS